MTCCSTFCKSDWQIWSRISSRLGQLRATKELHDEATLQQPPPLYSHYTHQPAPPVKNWRILLVQSFTVRRPLLMATSTFGLRRRHWSSQQFYLHCLCTKHNEGEQQQVLPVPLEDERVGWQVKRCDHHINLCHTEHLRDEYCTHYKMLYKCPVYFTLHALHLIQPTYMRVERYVIVRSDSMQ